jgi:hypothetical protein
MKKREFNALLKRLTTKKVFDINKIPTLSDEERSRLVTELVRRRLPIVAEFVPDGFDVQWLYCCGYLYTEKNEHYTFLCTCENRLMIK